MQFTNLFDDDRAVSPVIGVILMVAITVILAAVIGTFVLGMSDQMGDNAPRASFGFNSADDGNAGDGPDSVTITHESGDSITDSNLLVKVTSSYSQQWATNGDKVSAGDSFTVADSDSASSPTQGSATNIAGETIRVVYDSPDSDSTTTLQKFEVPE